MSSWWWLASWVWGSSRKLGSPSWDFFSFLCGAGISLFACYVRGKGGATPETISMLLGLGILLLNQAGCYFKSKPAGVPSHFCRKQLSDYVARLNEMLLCPLSACARDPVSGHQGSTAWVCEPLAPRCAKGPGPNEAQLWIQRGQQITRESFSLAKKNLWNKLKGQKNPRCWIILDLNWKGIAGILIHGRMIPARERVMAREAWDTMWVGMSTCTKSRELQ